MQTVQSVASALQTALSETVSITAQLLPTVLTPPRLSSGTAFVVAALTSVDSVAVLELELPVLGKLLAAVSRDSGEHLPASTLTRVEEGVFGHLALVALRACRETEPEPRLDPRLLCVGVDRSIAASHLAQTPHLVVRLSFQLEGAQGAGWLYLPSHSLALYLLSAPHEPSPAVSPELLATELSAHASLGCVELGAEELGSLAPGDVVLLPELRRTGDTLLGPGALRFRTFSLVGSWNNQGFQFARLVPGGVAQEEGMPQPLLESRPGVSVELSIELGRWNVSLATLAGIQPGGVLPLRLNPHEPVLLRVGDRAVARAELVEVEGDVGARVLSLVAGEER
jgi:type III secretion protein Q